MCSTDLNEVNLRKGLQTAWLLNIKNGDDVLMVEVSQKFHLTQRPQTEHGMVERRNLLDRDLLARRLVDSRTLLPISADRSSQMISLTRRLHMHLLQQRPGYRIAQIH
jgi:hypothetical protein